MLISDINTILYEIVWAVVQGHLKKELASTLLLESLVSVFRAFDAIQCSYFFLDEIIIFFDQIKLGTSEDLGTLMTYVLIM